jgi:hypothetical protein
MASISEFEQQNFWKDKPVEVILGDNSDWVTEYVHGWDINITYNKKFLNAVFGEESTTQPKATYKATILNFKNENT